MELERRKQLRRGARTNLRVVLVLAYGTIYSYMHHRITQSELHLIPSDFLAYEKKNKKGGKSPLNSASTRFLDARSVFACQKAREAIEASCQKNPRSSIEKGSNTRRQRNRKKRENKQSHTDIGRGKNCYYVHLNNNNNTKMDEEYLLKWKDYQSNFFSLAEELFASESLTDVTLCCRDQVYEAHRLVLSVCSPYFKAIFTRANQGGFLGNGSRGAASIVVFLKVSLACKKVYPF